MNLSARSNRGTSHVKYDEVKMLAIQLNDNKVVSTISTLGEIELTPVKRRIGHQLSEFTFNQSLQEYQKDMFAVDKVDQSRKSFGGFASKSHFNKWF